MHTIVNGFLSYGLLNVPVAVCPASRSQDLKFTMMHKDCGGRIGMPRTCKDCGETDLGANVIETGFEFSKGQFVTLPEYELAQIAAEKTKIIKIVKFVNFDEVDELQVEKNYYLNPNAMLTRPYTLLSNAMGEKQVVGVGSQSLWGKEHPAMVWAKEGGALILSNLFCYDEILSDEEIQSNLGLVPQDEQDLANQLVAMMLRPLNPKEDFVSDSRRRMSEYIEAKVNGLELEFAEPQVLPEATVDIQAQLRASILAARSGS